MLTRFYVYLFPDKAARQETASGHYKLWTFRLENQSR